MNRWPLLMGVLIGSCWMGCDTQPPTVFQPVPAPNGDQTVETKIDIVGDGARMAAGAIPSPQGPPAEDLVAAAEDRRAEEIRVRLGDERDLAALLEASRGRLVLVDFWATWCGPCVRQFPHTVEMARQWETDLTVIAVSMDDPDDLEKVRYFVADQKVPFDTLVSRYGIGQESFEAFQIDNGSLPHYKLYDRQGNLRHSADDNEGLGERIRELLD